MKSYKTNQFQKKAAIRKKVIKRRIFLKSKLFWDLVLSFLFFSCLAYWLVFSPVFKVKNIQVISNDKIPVSAVKQLVANELNKKWLIVKRNSFFLINAKTIQNKISQDFPLSGQVNVKKGITGNFFVEIKPRITQSIWCFASPKLPAEASFIPPLSPESSFSCFLVDQQRIIFSKAIQENLQNNLPIVFSETAQKPIFSQSCSQNLMDRIIETQKLLAEKFEINNVSFVEKANGFLNVKTVENWEIYFDPKNDLAMDLTKLRILLEKDITPEQRKNLQYIDLRFSKAYYK